MFRPEEHRLLMLFVLSYVAYVFLSTGAVVAMAGLLLALEARPESAVLMPIGLFLLHVGMAAIDSTGARRER